MAKPERPSLLDSIVPNLETPASEQSAEVVEISTTTSAPAKRDVVKSTIYLPPTVHRKLKEIAFAKDCKVHDLIMQGVSTVLQEHGHPTVEELKEK